MSETQTEEQAAPEGGLLDGVQMQVEEPAQEDDAIEHVDKAASGEKPEWLPDRFWNADDAEADYENLAKSQQELYKKLRNGKHLIPEGDKDYDVKFLQDKLSEDDAMLSKFREVAKDRGLTQDDFESIVTMVMDAAPPAQDPVEEQFDRETELRQLGPNAEEMINGHVKWAQSLVQRGVWTEDDWSEFQVWGGTAAGIRALTRLRQYYGEKTIPVQAVPDGEDTPTGDELQQMVASAEYQTNPAYRNKVYKQFQRVYGKDGHAPNFG
jgi:hypothetical protein